MEDPQGVWETDEACDDCGGKMGWVLDKGLTVGKRILVTGFVMTSAPIVLPPVLVISAIGFVCSIPYGFFLASYACTEKLMSILLPVSATGDMVERSQPLLGYEVHDDDVDDVGTTYRRRGFGKGEMSLFRALDFDVEEKGKSSVVGGLGLGEGEGEKVGMEEMLGEADDALGVVINIETDEKPSGNAKEAQAPFEVTNISIDVFGTPAGHKEDEMVKETIELIEKMRDEGVAGGEVAEEKKIDTGKKVNEAPQGSAGMEGPVATGEPKVTGFPESKKDVAIPQEEKKAQGAKGSKLRKGKAKTGKQVEAKKEKEVSGAGKVTTTPAGLQEIGADSEEKGGRVISSYAEHKMADPLKIAVSPGGYDLTRVEITPAESAAAADQELYSEEQIRKQIDAMRKIVGCTTPRHETFIEELKELYILTGVEPPASFKDLSGIVEVNHNLRFLMSIVGVK